MKQTTTENVDECRPDDAAGSLRGGSPSARAKGNGRGLFRFEASQAFHLVAKHLLQARLELLALGHLLVFVLVFWVAFLLRFDFAVPPSQLAIFQMSVPLIVGIKLVVFYLMGHYHGWWRFVTFADLAALLRASLASLLTVVAIDHFLLDYQISRTILLLDFLVGILALGGFRSSWRLLDEHLWPSLSRRGYRSALLVGTDSSTGRLAHQIHGHRELQYRIKGFLATNGGKVGERLGQIPVVGRLEDVGDVALSSGATDILLTAGTLPGVQLRSLMLVCKDQDLSLKIIPPLEDLFCGNDRIPIRDIEIDDLLRREPVVLDTEVVGDLVEGRTVMVTGAGGSIGSEICRQLIKFRPHSLVLVGRGENRIFHVDRELRSLGAFTCLYPCIGDVTDRDRMRQVFQEYRPEVVFHAAAHKHVPLMEVNVGEAIKSNVRGTRCMADLADEFEVKCFVLVSTDKAVNPTSVMGATKQLAERYIHALSQESSTRFVVVRFGNVLGSAGSVVPIFQEQIRHGGPITVTDAQMTRFFMTIPEASQLVLQAAAMGRGGEIFVLDMGKPVRIVDLARDLVGLSGLPADAIDIEFTGVRPGEKLYEELYFENEETIPTSHPKLRAAYHRPCAVAEMSETLSELEQMCHLPDVVIRQRLHELIPEFGGFSSPDDGKRKVASSR